jgi:hypothetical protein
MIDDCMDEEHEVDYDALTARLGNKIILNAHELGVQEVVLPTLPEKGSEHPAGIATNKTQVAEEKEDHRVYFKKDGSWIEHLRYDAQLNHLLIQRFREMAGIAEETKEQAEGIIKIRHKEIKVEVQVSYDPLEGRMRLKVNGVDKFYDGTE